MIVTVFRSRLMPGVREEYLVLAGRMNEIARTMPGYISHKGFFADDGERVTIVEFENEEGMRAWRMDPEHRAAQKKGTRELLCRVLSAGLRGAAGLGLQAGMSAAAGFFAWPPRAGRY